MQARMSLDAQRSSGSVLTETVTAPAPPPRVNELSLLDQLLQAPTAQAEAPRGQLQAFLDEQDTVAALKKWLGRDAERLNRETISLRLTRDIAYIDRLLNRQLNEILHHQRFQKLEGTWRGLAYLVKDLDPPELQEPPKIKIKLLNASWKDLNRDAEIASDFDQSQFFKRVYTDEFDSPGGEPYGLLLGDFDITHRPSAEHPTDDIPLLTSISQAAAAAFSPFICAANPAMFGVNSFTELERPINLAQSFDQVDFAKWRSFRENEDSRFIGMVMPRTLIRIPYEHDPWREDDFNFTEDVSKPDRSQYLWGNAIWAFGSVVIRAFKECGWLADIRGVRRGAEDGGVVTDLPVHCFSTDKRDIALKSSTDYMVSDLQERELAELGFLPLSYCTDTEYSVFYATQSTQKPKKYNNPVVNTNARMTAMLQYTLCVARFAHYLKILGREKIGSFADEHDLQSALQDWLRNYVADDNNASPEVKAKFPLREGEIEVRAHPDKPGTYLSTMRLLPHFQIDGVNAAVQLKTELRPARAG